MQEVPKENEVKDLNYFKDQVAREYMNIKTGFPFLSWVDFRSVSLDRDPMKVLMANDRAAELYAKGIPVTVLQLGEFLIQIARETNSVAEQAEALLQHFDIKRKK